MNYVQPIRDPEMIKKIIEYLKKWDEKYYIMFMIGIYTGRRVTDILKLRVQDVINKDSLLIRKEIKTGKMANIGFNVKLKKALQPYCENKPLDEFLIKSRKGANKPLTRYAAFHVLDHAAKEFGLDQIGTHTMRKTFGYHMYYASNKDIVLVMEALGHSSEQITLRYIGVTNEKVNDVVKKLNF